MISRILKYTLLVVIVYLIQAVIIGQFEFFRAKPDLFLIIIVAAAFFGDEFEGIAAGLAIGLFRDIMSTGSLGFYTLLGLCAALFTGLVSKKLVKNNAFVFAMVIVYVTAATEAAACILKALLDFVQRAGMLSIQEYIYYLRTYSLPMVAMNGVLAVIMYFIIKKILFSRTRVQRTGWAG
jgi:rod shape-determining protein MreD